MKMLSISSADVQFNDFDPTEQDLDIELDYSKLQDENVKGFIGKAFIYEEEIFINTITGEGYDLVLKRMKSYIDWYSGKIRLAGFERDDIKQLIVLILLDGIRRYNPNLKISGKKIKLSTFLYVHIKNRIISRIKEETRQSLNATYNEPMYKFICPCGTSFVAERDQKTCKSCKRKVGDSLGEISWTIRPEHLEPISLDNLMQSVNEDDLDKSSRVYYNGQKNNFIDFFGHIDDMDDFDRNLDLYSVLKEEDEVTRKIASLMYGQDYSITDAAKEVGLTCWAASLRLKKLKNKRHIKEFFLNK